MSGERMKTEIGTRWRGRLDASEQYHVHNAREWTELRDLLIARYELSNRWGANVAMGWSVIQNLIGSTYYKNPDPRIQPKTAKVSKDVSRMLESVFRGIHSRQNTEDIMKDALLYESFAGFGGHWTSFEQEDPEPEILPTGQYEPNPETGEPEETFETVQGPPVRQEVLGQFVEPFDLRFDPEGRQWDLSDHKYIVRRYYRTLQEYLDDPDYENKDMLEEWVRANGKRFHPAPDSLTWSEKANHTERDPRYLLVPCWEIWSKAEYRVYHVPVGALFHIGDYEWPDEWKAARRYPLVFVALNKVPGDKQKKEGFYPKPSLAFIRTHLENLNRLEALFLDTATLSIRKYLYIKGLIGESEVARIADSDIHRDMIPIDLKNLAEAFNAQGITFNWAEFDLRRLVTLMPQEDRSEATRHMEAIAHELNLIYQIIGQGPADRGGLAEANSATEALNLAARLEQRIDERIQKVGKFYNQITENFWTTLRRRQTLPIVYQLLVDSADTEAVWGEFSAIELEDMDLVFDHVTGSSRSRNRAQELMERREVLQLALPVLQALGKAREIFGLLKWAIEPANLRFPDGLFDDALTDLAKQAAVLVSGVESGRVSPEQAASATSEILGHIVSAVLTPADMQEVAQMVDEIPLQEGGGSGGDVASLPSAQSAGQIAASEAAAGAVGGLG